MYNILKVARISLLVYFVAVFDSLAKLVADPDPNVQNAAALLSNLLKDVVAEGGPEGLDVSGVFIPALKDKLPSVNPFVRQFLISWITLLDSVPGMGLVQHLTDFLGGLIEYLSDDRREIRAAAQHVQQAGWQLVPPRRPPQDPARCAGTPLTNRT